MAGGPSGLRCTCVKMCKLRSVRERWEHMLHDKIPSGCINDKLGTQEVVIMMLTVVLPEEKQLCWTKE